MIEDDSDSEEEVEKEEGAAEVKKEKQEKSESKEDDATNLSKYFSVGQYVRAYVTKCGETSTTAKSAAEHTKHRKHIELSLQPTLANSGVTKNELVVGCALQASVTSVEDHGLIMDLGLEDSSISGFISSNEIGQGMSLSDIQEGQVMLCKILGLSSTGKIIKLSGDVGKPVGAKAAKGGAGWKGGLWVSEAPTIDAFTPGTGVELLVTEVGQSGGLSGKIMGMVDGTVNFFHAGGWESTALEERVKEGNKVSIILWKINMHFTNEITHDRSMHV